MAMDAIACIRRNGGCVAIKLSLGVTNGGIIGWGSFGGDGAQDGDREGGSDGGSGKRGGF